METPELKVNISQIEREFSQGLRNAEVETQAVSNPGITPGADPAKLKLNVPKVASKLICDIKNGIAVRMVSKDMDEDTKQFIRDQLRTTDKEVILYQGVLEQLGTDLTPEEYKAMLNRWLCSPLVLIIEFEIQRMVDLRNNLKVFMKNQESKKGAA